jgi:hypothetical protein
VLAQDFHGDRALAGDDVGVVERMYEGQALFAFEGQRMGVRIGVAVPAQHDLTAQRLDGLDLHLRRRHRHHDYGAGSKLVRGQRHALRVVARRSADDTPLQLFRRELDHLVVGAAQLEAEDRLLVFPLEQHLVVQPPAEVARGLECRFDRDVVDPRGEDLLQVVGWLEMLCHDPTIICGPLNRSDGAGALHAFR